MESPKEAYKRMKELAELPTWEEYELHVDKFLEDVWMKWTDDELEEFRELMHEDMKETLGRMKDDLENLSS